MVAPRWGKSYHQGRGFEDLEPGPTSCALPLLPQAYLMPLWSRLPHRRDSIPLGTRSRNVPFLHKVAVKSRSSNTAAGNSYKPGLEFELFSSFSLASPIPMVLGNGSEPQPPVHHLIPRGNNWHPAMHRFATARLKVGQRYRVCVKP